MPFYCGESLMDSNGWEFHFGGADSDTVTSLDANGSMCGSGSSDCGVNNDQILGTGLYTPENTNSRSSGVTNVQGAFQGLDLQDLLGQAQTSPTMPFCSNHLLVAAKFFQQKRLQRALAKSNAHVLSAGHSHTDDTLSYLSQGTHDGAKFSYQRSWEGFAGMTNESPSIASNGSKTSSPQQVSPDSSSPAAGSLPYIGCSFGREHAEHHNFIFQARPDYQDAMLDPFNCGSVHVKQVQDAMWPSYPQVPRGVLVPSFSSHNGGNQPPNHCEVGTAKTKPRVRARRGQATDPHSIAERLRRERIADRIKALQELVPNTNKTDRAIMLDEIIEYVKFLLIQVKLLSMSRLGSAALSLPIVSGLTEATSLQTPSEIQGDGPGNAPESLSAIEEYFARLISNNVGAALQFIQKKGLCLVPLTLTDASKPSTDAGGNPTRSLNLLG